MGGAVILGKLAKTCFFFNSFYFVLEPSPVWFSKMGTRYECTAQRVWCGIFFSCFLRGPIPGPRFFFLGYIMCVRFTQSILSTRVLSTSFFLSSSSLLATSSRVRLAWNVPQLCKKKKQNNEVSNSTLYIQPRDNHIQTP